MKRLFPLLLLPLMLTACKTYESRMVTDSGPASAPAITLLHVMPAILPDEMHGRMTDEEREVARREWPMAGARVIADAVTRETDERVTAMTTQEKPESGHYFTVEISYLDVGDPEARAANVVGGKREGWSLVRAKGKLIDADKNEVVAEFDFSQSSGLRFKKPYENDMYNVGRELGRWLDGRRK